MTEQLAFDPPPAPTPADAGVADEPVVEVRRSTRRRRTVSAYREGARTIVLLPARMTRAEEAHWVTTMVERLDASERRRRPSDLVLMQRAGSLSRRYLDGRAVPSSVRWVDNQRGRWGSCTPADGTIRLSKRLQGLPAYVIDYVLLHELVHLLVPGHGPRFWAMLESYPKLERARGYLDGVSVGAGLEPDDSAADDPADAGEIDLR
jgi:YgjP-like, metallopeptidase domain